MRHLIAPLLTICIFSFIAFGISVAVLGTDHDADTDTAETIVYSGENHINESYSKIKADIGVCNLDILPHDSDTTVINTDENIVNEVKVWVSGSTLHIETGFHWDSSKDFADNLERLFSSGSSGNILVYIPDKVYEEFRSDVGIGSLNASGISASKVKLYTNAGETKYESADGFTHTDLDIEVNAGECTFENATAAEYDLELNAGELHINELSGEGKIRVNAGTAKVSYSEFSGEADTEVNAGELHLTLPENASAKIDCDASAGEVKITEGIKTSTLADDSKYILGGGEHKLKAEVNAGSITINANGTSSNHASESKVIVSSAVEQAVVDPIIVEPIDAIE